MTKDTEIPPQAMAQAFVEVEQEALRFQPEMSGAELAAAHDREVAKTLATMNAPKPLEPKMSIHLDRDVLVNLAEDAGLLGIQDNGKINVESLIDFVKDAVEKTIMTKFNTIVAPYITDPDKVTFTISSDNDLDTLLNIAAILADGSPCNMDTGIMFMDYLNRVLARLDRAGPYIEGESADVMKYTEGIQPGA